MTWDEVVERGLKLTGVTLSTSYGTPALKGGKALLLAQLRPEGDMVLRVEDGLREALIELQPNVFHTTPHYDCYPLLLVRLEGADGEQIGGLIECALKPAKTGPTAGKSRKPRA